MGIEYDKFVGLFKLKHIIETIIIRELHTQQ